MKMSRQALIDLREADAVRGRRPLLVAHRGGVVAPEAPENSLAAIRLAAARGYDMVELDVTKPKDDEPVIFHGGEGRLLTNCGLDVALANLTAHELSAVRYRASDEHIATFSEALALCNQLGLGVMLDVKAADGAPLTPTFMQRVGTLLGEHGLTNAAVTISRHPLVRGALADRVLFPVAPDDTRRVLAGQPVPLHGQFWFGLPDRLPDEAVPALQRSGALVIPAINTFRYPPHAHALLARQDADRLRAAGVDGFQIDSVYGQFFGAA